LDIKDSLKDDLGGFAFGFWAFRLLGFWLFTFWVKGSFWLLDEGRLFNVGGFVREKD
jgi:hypothetical protein